MNSFSNQELLVILGYYYFESKKNDTKIFQKFVRLFNDSFQKDISEQLLNYQLALFKNVDSSHNIVSQSQSNSETFKLWNYYISQERIDLLKKVYKSFKNKDMIHKSTIINVDDYEAINILNSQIGVSDFTFVEDKIKEVYKFKEKSCKYNTRDIQVSINALHLANFRCECSKNHETFFRKDGKHLYTEGHHLIPLKFQDRFNVNLDVEANVVSLCSNCHNRLHYGYDPEVVLKKLFTEERQSRLAKCGIDITLAELIKLYE